MHANLQLIVLMLVTSGAGWLMFEAGVFKHLLERRRERRVCPSCGRETDTCACS